MTWQKALWWLGSVIALGSLLLSLDGRSSLAASPASASQTLADRRLHIAQTLVHYLPNSAEGYNQLASAYLLKSRETGDFSNIVKAESALDQSLHLEPDNQFDNQFGNQSGNGEALKLQLILLLTEHRFREGLDLAEQLQSRFPNDSQIETALIDAHVELGNYQAAIATADALISSCPSAPVYARRSYLRSLHGNSSAAIADMQKAIKTANPRDHEGLAWYNVHLGIELLNAGHWAAGEQAIDQALEVFPNYPIALSAKARARLSDQDWQQAVHYYQRSQMQMPLPDTAMALGDLHKHLGDRDAAERQYDLVDFLVRSGGEPFEKAYAHQLVLFWADQEQHLDQALNLIEQEKMTRSDIYTYDALAWCLFKLGRRSQAKEAIDQALQLHTLDARIYYHAGQIYHSQGEDKKAIQFLKQALKINPVFHPLQADLARQVLASLGEQLDF